MCLLALLSCSRPGPSSPFRRIALLPGNVLTADPASEWLSVAVPLVLAQDLASATDIVASVVANDTGVYQSGSTLALRVTVEDQGGGELALSSSLRDVAAQRNVRVLAARRPASQVVAALDGLARQIDTRAIPFPTRNPDALKAFSLAVATDDTALKEQRLRDAVTADPSFGLAYLVLLQTLNARSDPDLANALVQAGARRASFTPIDRARFDVLRARLQHSPLAEQSAASAALLKLAPNDLDALATAANCAFLTGNGRQGEALLNRAIVANPESGDLRRQLALGLLETRQFSRAANLLAQLPPSPAVLFDAAIALSLAGDGKQAGAAHERFLAAVGNDELKTLLRARWQALTGRREEAIRQLESSRFSDARIAAVVRAELVVWHLLGKQVAAARSASIGAGPLAQLLADGASSADAWRAKVSALPETVASPAAKTELLRYGPFLLGFYPQAVAEWRAADTQAGGSDLVARAMLAAALRASGDAAGAAKIPVQPFVPDEGDAFSVVPFTELRRALGQAL